MAPPPSAHRRNRSLASHNRCFPRETHRNAGRHSRRCLRCQRPRLRAPPTGDQFLRTQLSPRFEGTQRPWPQPETPRNPKKPRPLPNPQFVPHKSRKTSARSPPAPYRPQRLPNRKPAISHSRTHRQKQHQTALSRRTWGKNQPRNAPFRPLFALSRRFRALPAAAVAAAA